MERVDLQLTVKREVRNFMSVRLEYNNYAVTTTPLSLSRVSWLQDYRASRNNKGTKSMSAKLR